MGSGDIKITALCNVSLESFVYFGCHSIPAAEDNPFVSFHYVERRGRRDNVILTVSGSVAEVVVTEVLAVIPLCAMVNLIKNSIGKFGSGKAPFLIVILSPKRRAVSVRKAVKVTLNERNLSDRTVCAWADILITELCKVGRFLKIRRRQRLSLGNYLVNVRMYFAESRFKTYVVVPCEIERIIFRSKSLGFKRIKLVISAVKLVCEPGSDRFLFIGSVRTSAESHYLLHISRRNLYDCLVYACLKVIRKKSNRLSRKNRSRIILLDKRNYFSYLTLVGLYSLITGFHSLNGVLRTAAGLVSLRLRGIPAAEFSDSLSCKILACNFLDFSKLLLGKL